MDNFTLGNYVDDFATIGSIDDFVQDTRVLLIRNTKKNTEIYKQEANDSTKKVIFESVCYNLNRTDFRDRTIIEYDAINSQKNTHELVHIDKYKNVLEQVKLFDDEAQYLSSTKGLKETNFQFYLVTFKSLRHTYRVISKFSNVLEMSKKFLVGNFTDNKITFNNHNEVFGLNKKIEMFIIDDTYLVINQAEASFENIFKMQSVFTNGATKILNENDGIKSIIHIESMNLLKDKVKDGKRIARRLIKIVEDEDRFKQTVENMDRIQEILSDSKSEFYEKIKDVEYKDGKLSVTPGNEDQLVFALSDAFYQAFISQTKNIDGSRINIR